MTMTEYSPQYLAESKTTVLNVFYAIPIPLEIFSTLLRIWVKTKDSKKGGFAFDDYLMVWATIVVVAQCIAGLVYGAPYGLGRHIQAVSAADFQTFMLGNYIFSHLYDVAIASTKLSVLALYFRIFATRTFRTLVLATAIFVIFWVITMEVVLGLECRPIQAWWGAAQGSCLNLVAFAYFTNITNLVTDMWIFAMPIRTILGLQASRNKKVTLCFLFSIGLGTCAISAARLSVVFSEGSSDITWNEVPLGILSVWEPCGGILCANLPVVYKPLVNAFTHTKARVTSASFLSSSKTNSSQRYTKGSMTDDWLRLNNSGSGVIPSDVYQPAPHIRASKHAKEGIPMTTFGSTEIIVEHNITQDVYSSFIIAEPRTDQPHELL